jgi:hypothetical protein
VLLECVECRAASIGRLELELNNRRERRASGEAFSYCVVLLVSHPAQQRREVLREPGRTLDQSFGMSFVVPSARDEGTHVVTKSGFLAMKRLRNRVRVDAAFVANRARGD